MKLPASNVILEIKEFPKYPNEIGMKFGYLKVLYEVEHDQSGVLYMLECKCGNRVLRDRANLIYRKKHNMIQNCGCYNMEMIKKLPKKKKHGYSTGKKERLYRIWSLMRHRCNSEKNKDYKHYGAKGIKVCEEWDDYIIFRKWAKNNGYKKNLTIDRIDGNKNYFPDNCRWVTQAEQCRNTTQNSKFLINGEWFLLVDLSKKFGVGTDTIKRMATDGRLEYEQWVKPTSGRYYNKND